MTCGSDDALAKARALLSGSDNITYPSLVAARYVRNVIAALVRVVEQGRDHSSTDVGD